MSVSQIMGQSLVDSGNKAAELVGRVMLAGQNEEELRSTLESMSVQDLGTVVQFGEVTSRMMADMSGHVAGILMARIMRS